MTTKQVGAKRKHNINDSFFSILTEQSAYWLGFMYADGYLHPKENASFLTLSCKDESHLEKLKQQIQFEGPILKHMNAYSEEYVATCKARIRLSSATIKNDLISLGCTLSKTLTCTFPVLPEEMIPHFIRGYFDGDGSVYTIKPYGRMVTPGIGVGFIGTEEFLSILKIKLGFNDCKTLRVDKRLSNNNPIRQLEFGGANIVARFYKYMYTEATVWLERKKNVFDNFWNTKGRSETIIQPS